MNFQDRDRLGLSVFLAASIFALLFFLLNLVPWAGFNPFPKSSPPVFVQLQAPPIPEPPPAVPRVETAKPRPEPEEPVPEPETELRKSEASDSKTSAVSSAAKQPPAGKQPGGAPPAGPAAKTPADPGPPARVNRPNVDMTDPSTWNDRSRPPAPTTTANRDEGIDLAIRNELEYLNKEAEKLERWFKDNPRYGAPPKRGDETGASEEKRDPVAAAQAERLKELNKKIDELRKRLSEQGPGRPGGPGGDPARGPVGPGKAGPQPQPHPAAPAPGGGVNIKGLDYGGRVLESGNKPVLETKDFDGFPPRFMEVKIDFLINERGIVEPSSLIISGETRYTKVTEKIQSALAGWRFSSSPGATSKGKVTFEIRMSDVR